MDTVTDLDRGIIRNMMLKHSHKEIADLLGYTVPVVAACIELMVSGTAIVTRQMVIESKKIAQAKPVKKKKPLKEKKIEAEWREQKEQKKLNTQEKIEHVRKQQTAAWLARKTFKTIPVDLKKLVSVKIDDKTAIFIKPGEDVEAARKKFFKNRIAQVKTENVY